MVTTLRYRADVDGLRAIAIVAVVLYHFGVSGFSGGFVGVDIFFVISGFIIASMIDTEIGERRFSLVYFYERRIRRIFPALMALLFAASVVAYLELFPRTYKDFGESLGAASVFLSNVEFWREAGNYFYQPYQDEPLLHTWSLAIEAQFYFLFPPLMMLLARHSKERRSAILLAVLFVSLGLSVVGASVAPVSAFYLFPSRAWELLLGALIWGGPLPSLSNRFVSVTLSALGVTMIVCAIAGYTRATVFPGAAALLPCIGAALIIYSGRDDRTAINQMLSARVVVFIGLISYSLYLWHWPILVFAKYHVGRDLSSIEIISLIAASFGIAALSWRFVEKPFRRPGGSLSRHHVFLQAAAATLIFFVSGAAIHLTNGAPQRFTPDLQLLLEPETEAQSAACEFGQAEQTIAGSMCRLGRPDGRVTFLVWGDSHAWAVSPAIARVADRLGHSGLIKTVGGCAPLLGRFYPDWELCRRHNDAMLKFVQTHEIDTVILAAHWTANAERSTYGLEKLGSMGHIQDDESNELSLEEDHRVFARALARTVTALRASGKRVVIVGQVPEIGRNVPRTLAQHRMRGLSEDIGPSVDQFELRNKTVLEVFRSMEGTVDFVYPHRILCSEARCAVARQGRSLYSDDTHLHRFGAETISSIFEPVFSSQN